ncbi:TonB-dependent receptor [Carboxylicivirga sp. A043]|uniref:SusC/RagA family TonB-linked outer membrane protein n=1 Tax=Carboxylicivirga litoralis TaxID=2816963 RepID=UPI0021CB6ED1|nr:TonB-dependent receptor [Carboxylicivirga sp. A043]MCU4156728.1 TonB-dependent receptor [Carboxylicivirga sp. A043]
MKKNRKWYALLFKLAVPRKLLLIMKISFILLFAVFMQISAAGFAQKVVIKKGNITYKQLFSEIREQTGIVTILSNDEIDLNSDLIIESKSFELEQLLNEITKGTELTYELIDNYLVIRPLKPEEKLRMEQVAQQPENRVLTGTIKDESGLPIPGANVFIKGTQNGTITDANGVYAFEISVGHDVLVVSFIGMETQELLIADKKVIDVTLISAISSVDEVVVIGYGSTKRERIGSAISQVKAEDIEQQSIGVTSFENILGGNVKGLQVSQGSGAPGASSTIRLRGITSPFSGGNNQPLYVIDGVEFNTDQVSGAAAQNPLEAISPSDIKSISVLKDAGATAIYGSRGANGVIIVTTKRGQRDSQLSVTMDASLSISNPVKKWDLLDADEFKQLHQMIAVNTYNKFGGTNEVANLIYNGDGTFNDMYYDAVLGETVDMWGTSNTDWQDELYRTNAPVQKYNLTMAGGTERTNYSATLYYNSVKGLIINDIQKRYGSRLSVDTDVNDWMRLGSSLNVSGARNAIGRNVNAGNGPLTEAIGARPDMPVMDETGFGYVRQVVPTSYTVSNGIVNYTTLQPNIVASTLNDNVTKSLSVFANGYVEVQPFKDFKLKTDLNVANFVTKGSNFQPLVAQDQNVSGGNFNKKYLGYSNALSTTLNFQAYYTKQLENHTIDLMAGVSSNKVRHESESHSFTNMADDVYMTNVETGLHEKSSEAKAENVMNSWFSRLQYSYKGRYTLTANMRSDKSSKFGPGNKRGYFPSGAVNWNVAQENFMKNQKVLNVLKLRASYGKTGLANISDFTYLRYWSTPWDHISYMGNTVLLPENIYPNEDIKWETTKELNIGLDFGLFNNRLYGGIDYYDKYTSDAIMDTPIFPETGAAVMYDNRAEISNTGMEFELGGNIIQTNDFVWNVNLNIAYNRNVLESIEGNAISQWVVGQYVEGEPIGILSGLQVSHVIRDQAEIDALNAKAPSGYYQDATTSVGDYLYKDRNGDGQINAEDKTIIGTQEPDFFGGFSTNLSYKNLSFTAGFQYSVGNEKRWYNAAAMYLTPGTFANMGHEALYDTYTDENTDAQYPMLAYGNRNNSYFKRMINDEVVQDASYLRLKVVNLSYRVPEQITDKLQIEGLTIYVGGTNLLTFTKYKGLDPESMAHPYNGPGETGNILSGVRGQDAYPMARTYTMGLKLTF